MATYVGEVHEAAPWLDVAKGLGAAGALCQIGAGACRIRLGLQQHDQPLLRLGALDVGVGLLSLGWNLASVSSPWLTGAYVATLAAREGYANRELIKRSAQKIRCAYGRCRLKVTNVLRSLTSD